MLAASLPHVDHNDITWHELAARAIGVPWGQDTMAADNAYNTANSAKAWC